MIQKLFSVMILSSSILISCGESDNKKNDGDGGVTINESTSYTETNGEVQIPNAIQLSGGGECSFLLPQSFSYEGSLSGIKMPNANSIDEPFVIALPDETRLVDADSSIVGSYSLRSSGKSVQKKVTFRFTAERLEVSLACSSGNDSDLSHGEAARKSGVNALPVERADTLR